MSPDSTESSKTKNIVKSLPSCVDCTLLRTERYVYLRLRIYKYTVRKKIYSSTNAIMLPRLLCGILSVRLSRVEYRKPSPSQYMYSEMRGSGEIFCGYRYPQFSRIRIVISLFERIRILCHGYSTDMNYVFILFYFFNLFYVYCLH